VSYVIITSLVVVRIFFFEVFWFCIII
jgi:hypothetical protein